MLVSSVSVYLQTVLVRKCLPTMFTFIGENIREMLGFHMVPHIGPVQVAKRFANGAKILWFTDIISLLGYKLEQFTGVLE